MLAARHDDDDDDDDDIYMLPQSAGTVEYTDYISSEISDCLKECLEYELKPSDGKILVL